MQRGHTQAAALIQAAPLRCLSVQTYLELLQQPRNQTQQRVVKQFIWDLHFKILPLTENIGNRAMVYVEEYGLSHGMRAGDALIAATATANALPLVSSNAKHFRPVQDLDLRIFHAEQG